MEYQTGQLVRSLQGRDSGEYLVVLKVEAGRIWVADGRLRPLGKPKAKNPRHLAQTNRFVSEDSLASDKLLIQAIRALAPKPAVS